MNSCALHAIGSELRMTDVRNLKFLLSLPKGQWEGIITGVEFIIKWYEDYLENDDGFICRLTKALQSIHRADLANRIAVWNALEKSRNYKAVEQEEEQETPCLAVEQEEDTCCKEC